MAWLWIPQFGLEVPPKIPNRNSANIQMDYHILSELKSLEGARCEIKMISVWRILIVVIHVFQHGCFCWAKLISLVFQLVAKSPNTRHKKDLIRFKLWQRNFTRYINLIMSGKTFLHLKSRPVKIPLHFGRKGKGHGLSAGFQGQRSRFIWGLVLVWRSCWAAFRWTMVMRCQNISNLVLLNSCSRWANEEIWFPIYLIQ